MDRLIKFCLPKDIQGCQHMNRPLQRIFPIVWIITKWRVDWQRSLRLERSIVEGLGVDTEDLLRFAIEASQIGSRYMKDNLNGTICCADHRLWH